MNEISDEFKLTVLDSIRSLATKFPRKYNVLLNFLSSLLRENAGYTFKKAVVLVFESIIKDIPDAKNLGLLLLCEFIEDCEHVKLTERILHLIGQEGPYLKRPRQFTRYIYNRVMLESAAVKCTATTALARFGAHNDELLPSILVLLQRIMLDEDDEVRDRAAFYHFILSSNDRALKKAYILTDPMAQSPMALEHALLKYVHDTAAQASRAFQLSAVSVATQEETTLQSALEKPATTFFEKSDKLETEEVKSSAVLETKNKPEEEYAEQFSRIPELSKLGHIFKSTSPIELTEDETEYVVTCVKHTMQDHIVLQFNCLNTMDNQSLANVSVELEPELEEFEVETIIPCPRLTYNKMGICYSICRLPEDITQHSCSFEAKLSFNVIEEGSDPDDEGFPDEYPLEPISIGMSDHIQRLLKANFGIAWNDLPEENEVEDTFVFERFKTVRETVRQMVEHLNMQPCDRSDQLSDETKSSHQLLLSGMHRQGVEVLVHCKIVRLQKNEGVTVQMTVRSSDPEISAAVMDSLV